MGHTDTFYNPPDFVEAHHAWGASCGPAALAAVIGQPLAAVRPFFPSFPARTFVNQTMMSDALQAAGHRWEKTAAVAAGVACWPACGLALIQWEGPWLRPGVPPRAAFVYTHWVGFRYYGNPTPVIYDVNADGWVSSTEWEEDIAPALMRTHKRATGWHVRLGMELERRPL